MKAILVTTFLKALTTTSEVVTVQSMDDTDWTLHGGFHS